MSVIIQCIAHQGHGGTEKYNGEYLAKEKNVIVVTINYRLGALGSLYFEGTDGTLSGNYGLKVCSLIRTNLSEIDIVCF